MSQTIGHRPADDQSENRAPNKKNFAGTEKEANEADAVTCTLGKHCKELVGEQKFKLSSFKQIIKTIGDCQVITQDVIDQ